MPTAYTNGVRTGKVSTLAEFALLCAKVIGVNSSMRDDPVDSPIKEYEPDHGFWRSSIERSERKLELLRSMSLEDAQRQVDELNQKARDAAARVSADKAEELERYHAMVAKVESWEPPTEAHQDLKTFMLNQLKDSIEFDCQGVCPKPYLIEDVAEWLRDQIQFEESCIENSKSSHAKDIEDCRKRNEWNRQLRDSLKEQTNVNSR